MNTLHLSGNKCVDENFEIFGENRQNVREALTKCFNNFDTPDDGSFIRCNYTEFSSNIFCEMEIFNPNGRDFDDIEGKLIDFYYKA